MKPTHPKPGRPPVLTSQEALSDIKVMPMIGETDPTLAKLRIERAMLKHAKIKIDANKGVKRAISNPREKLSHSSKIQPTRNR